MNGDVILRDWRDQDAALIPPLANDRRIWDSLRDEFPSPFRESDAVNFLHRVQNDSSLFSKAIECDNSLVGCITIQINDDIRRFSGVLGFWIGQAYWNRGIATAAIRQITDLAFEQLGLVRVYAKVFATNTRSIRALEKVGYVKEGHFRRAVFKNGRFCDQVLYAKVSSSQLHEE
jgi:RimJ/RimL family protein N-acetyltransferase